MKGKKPNPNEGKLYELTPGYTCNMNCRFCSIAHEKKIINKSTMEVMADVYKAKSEGYKILGFGGGEPTIRKDIFKLAKFAKKLKFDTIRIQTNGLLLGYGEFCKKLIQSGVNFVKLSVHGHKAQVQDYLTRSPGSFERILKGIDNLNRLGIRIEANIVITKMNYKFLPQYIDFFAQKGISSFCIIFPVYTGNMALNYKEVGLKISEAAPYVHEALDLIKSLELDKGLVFNIPFCYMKGYEDRVVEQYNMKLVTPHLIVDNADLDIKSGKTKPKGCARCSYTAKCSGIWKNYLALFGDKEFIPRTKS